MILPARLYWHYAGGQAVGQFTITVTRAATPQDACAALDVAFPSPLVHTLETPSLQRQLNWLRPGQTFRMDVERLPTARDYFIENGYR